MNESFRTKIFKSGNSYAVRLPRSLGVTEEGDATVREERGRFIVEPSQREPQMIDLAGIYGSIRGIERQSFDHKRLDWEGRRARRG